MKKNILIASLALILSAGSINAQSPLDDLSVSTSFAFESKYVFRGIQFSDEAFQPGVDFALGGAYAGVWASLPTFSRQRSTVADGLFDVNTTEVDFYAGYSLPSFDGLEEVAFDVGLTYYTFPDAADGFFDTDANSVEFYAGASLDTLAAPAVYIYYDIHLDTFTIEGSAGHSFPIDDKASFDVGGFLGVAIIEDADNLFYYGISADLAYAFSENVSGAIGARFSGTDEELTGFNEATDSFSSDKNAIWWGVSFSAGF